MANQTVPFDIAGAVNTTVTKAIAAVDPQGLPTVIALAFVAAMTLILLRGCISLEEANSVPAGPAHREFLFRLLRVFACNAWLLALMVVFASLMPQPTPEFMGLYYFVWVVLSVLGFFVGFNVLSIAWGKDGVPAAAAAGGKEKVTVLEYRTFGCFFHC
ncbi:hypothetical protein FN846DRAFT_892887 [Sphaerosporella brunnea]|uniref:Uncharacterized protein n=1 Tax=Sphaerosporella brunnea TaxID=1250544 RepID=A0A5J5EMP1_9PEZI|nr:hypothetical protein FN846DRAFT_892887 [Sphaerosporella brunnea]